MPLFTNCPGCQTPLALGEHLQGKKVRCKKCGHLFVATETVSPLEEAGEAAEVCAEIQREPLPAPRAELPPIPSLRRSRWGLIVALALSGLALFLLGGGVVLAIVLWKSSWNGVPELLDSDFKGSWPVAAPPGGFGADFPEDTVVTLHITGVEDDNTREAISDRALTLADGGQGSYSSASLGNRMTIVVAPVHDPQACADRVDFGTVRRVQGRTISVVAKKIEGLPADADAVAKALYHLKSPSFARRLEAARLLKKTPPDHRREEVARALHEALRKDHHFVSREEILEALAVWGNRDSVPVLLDALADENPFGRWAVFKALARLKDERACEPLAQHLEDFADRREAAEALKALGPIAEKAVLKRLQHPDHWVRSESCNVLRVIGTPASLPALERAAADTEGFVSDNAQPAIQAIKARQQAAK